MHWPRLEKLGATLVDVSLPRTELSIPVYYLIAPAEASSNLSRFDGVKFGHRAAEYTDLAGHVQARHALAGFRPRGEAPHHDRHLRAERTATTTPTTCRRRSCAA